MTAQEALEFAKKNDARQIDIRFTDLPGLNQHISYPIDMLDENSFEDGFRHRWLEHSRLGRNQRERHAAHSRSGDRLHGSVRRNTHRGDVGDIIDPITGSIMTAIRAGLPESRTVFTEFGAGRYRLFRRRS